MPAWPNTTAPPVALVRDYDGAPGVYTGGGEVTGRAFVLLDVERVAAQRAGMLQLLRGRWRGAEAGGLHLSISF